MLRSSTIIGSREFQQGIPAALGISYPQAGCGIFNAAVHTNIADRARAAHCRITATVIDHAYSIAHGCSSTAAPLSIDCLSCAADRFGSGILYLCFPINACVPRTTATEGSYSSQQARPTAANSSHTGWEWLGGSQYLQTRNDLARPSGRCGAMSWNVDGNL